METKIAFSPRGNKVLLRADFEVSTLNILNNEEINKIPAKAYTVMAVAENVKGLNVGDKVKLENGCIPTLIQKTFYHICPVLTSYLPFSIVYQTIFSFFYTPIVKNQQYHRLQTLLCTSANQLILYF